MASLGFPDLLEQGQNFGTSVAQAFGTGQNIALQRRQQEMREAQLRQQQLAADLEAKRLQQEALRKKQEELRKRGANLARFLAPRLKSGQITPDQATRIVQAQGVDPSMVFGEAQEAEPGQLSLRAESFASGELGAKDRRKPLTPAGRIASDEFSLTPGTPEFEQKSAEIRKDLLRQNLSLQRAGASRISIGPDELQGGTKRELEEKIISGTSALARMNEIIKDDPSDFLTYGGRAKAFFGSILDKLGTDFQGYAQFNADKRVFFENVAQAFNEYRKLITGAAASEQELKRLEESMLNPGLGPKEFAKSSQRFIDELQRNLRLASKFRSEGIDLSSKFGDDVLDDLLKVAFEPEKAQESMLPKGDAKSMSDILNRRRQLKKEHGLSEAGIIKQLAVEGYISKEQAKKSLRKLKGR